MSDLTSQTITFTENTIQISKAIVALIDDFTMCIQDTQTDIFIVNGTFHIRYADFHLRKCMSFLEGIDEIIVVSWFSFFLDN